MPEVYAAVSLLSIPAPIRQMQNARYVTGRTTFPRFFQNPMRLYHLAFVGAMLDIFSGEVLGPTCKRFGYESCRKTVAKVP